MKNTPIDDKILNRIHELGLGSRRGKTQAKRRLRKRVPVSNSAGSEFLNYMAPPSSFSGRTRLVNACSVASDFPPVGARKEIAFAGRANVGKSSLLNRLLGKESGMPDAALVEDKPGVTRQVSFYDIGKQLRLVDLPGYGFAYAESETVQSWMDLVFNYLLNRKCLSRVYVLVDGRHGLKQADKELLALLDQTRVKHQMVLTKGDLVKPVDLARQMWQVGDQTRQSDYCIDPVLALSSRTGAGVNDLRERAAQNVDGYKACYGDRKRNAIGAMKKKTDMEKEEARKEGWAERRGQNHHQRRSSAGKRGATKTDSRDKQNTQDKGQTITRSQQSGKGKGKASDKQEGRKRNPKQRQNGSHQRKESGSQ